MYHNHKILLVLSVCLVSTFCLSSWYPGIRSFYGSFYGTSTTSTPSSVILPPGSAVPPASEVSRISINSTESSLPQPQPIVRPVDFSESAVNAFYVKPQEDPILSGVNIPLESPTTLETTRVKRSSDYDNHVRAFVGHESNACHHDGPCLSGATCVPLPGSNPPFRCECPPGSTGPLCEKDIDECLEDPGICQNGATCHNTPGSFSCTCVNGWTGPTCDVNYDDCAQATCFNGATCVDKVGSFRCDCPPGKTGLLCQFDDSCASNPCKAEGSLCDTSPVDGSFFCMCPPGYKGIDCSEDVDECAIPNNKSAFSSIGHNFYRPLAPSLSPCEHEGKCINTIGSFRCDCPLGFTGPRCETNINECISNPCQNSGTCLDERGFFRCACMAGFTGSQCQINIDECESSPCSNGAICTDLVNGFKCLCPPGFQGPTCSENIDDCLSNPCLNGATCKDSLDSYTCRCPPGFNGPNCEVNINDCANSPCQNGGTCFDGINRFTCKCPVGYTGILCQNVVNECNSSPCMFGGTCVNLINPEPRIGSNSTILRRHPQLHSSILDGEARGFKCTCPPGTRGDRCEINLDECWSSPCMNNGTCTDLVNGFRCTCPPGWTGPTCSLDVDECSLYGICMNGATCINKIGGFECLCPKGYFGQTCTRDRDDCLSSPCMNGGQCRDHPGHGHYSCLCPAEFTGSRCESRSESNACNNNPCKHGGDCFPMSSGSSDGFKCACRPGFTGELCEHNIDDCASRPCLNGGRCLDGINSFTCWCPLPFNGTRCESSLDPCLVNSCSGRSRCIPSSDLGNYTCLCDPGFTGPTCSQDIDECALSSLSSGNTPWSRPMTYKSFLTSNSKRESLCMNGGVCVNNIGSFSCQCPKGFTGTRCEINIDECASIRDGQPICLNGGTCQDGIASFTCVCPQGYAGSRCELRVKACESSPCLQGARCTDAPYPSPPGSYKCHCPIGFSGRNCQLNDDDCTASSCLNGGTCIDGINSFTCQCPPGFAGHNCQFSQTKDIISQPTTICRSFRVGIGYESSNEQDNCVRSDPWKNCPIAEECFALFGNQQCDSQCNTRACLFDGMDCDGVAPGNDPSEGSGKCNALYEGYCIANYGNGHCDQGCNNKECGWDGLDCVNKSIAVASALPGSVTIVFDTSYEMLQKASRQDLANILRQLSTLLPGVVFEQDQVKPDPETGKGALELRVNQAYCDKGTDCFKSVIEVDEYLEASQILRNSLSPVALKSVFKISDVRAVDPFYTEEGDDNPSGGNPNPSLTLVLSIGFVLVASGVLIGVLAFGQTGFTGKVKKKRGITWFPEGFVRPVSRRDERRIGGAARAAGGDFSLRRGPRLTFPDGQEMHSLSSSTQLMSKEPGQIHEQDVMDTDPYGRKQPAYDSIYDEPEARPWTLQHLEAFQGRGGIGSTQLMSPPMYDTLKTRTPTSPNPVSPFGSPMPMSPGVGVDVRGPGGLTPLMVASAFDSQTLFCQQSLINSTNYPASPSALLLDNNASGDGQVSSPAPNQTDIIGELIQNGASLSKQAEVTGETPLHMAAKFARSDAAKRLLDAGADANAVDFKGRTPLHAAIAADAKGVFEILLRNRATDLNAQDEAGFTPLIVAVKNSMQDMVDELIQADANLDLQDSKGKTALHWSALVNNISAIRALLTSGANKDAQDNHEQTPLFLASREGAGEAVKLLVASGANRDITDHMDRLPRDVAAELQHRDIVSCLDEAAPQISSVIYGQTNLYGQTLSPPQVQSASHIRSVSQDVQEQKPRITNPRQSAGAKKAAAAQARRPSCSSSSSDPNEGSNETAPKPPRSRHERGSSTLGRTKKASTSSQHQRSHSAARASQTSQPLQQIQPSNGQQKQGQQPMFISQTCNEPISIYPGTTTFYGNGNVVGNNGNMMPPQGALLSPPSSSSPRSSSFSPASSSHALSPHTSVASPYSTSSSHVSSPPHHQQFAPMSFPPVAYSGQHHHMQSNIHHPQHQTSQHRPLHHLHQQQVPPPPAYDEAVYGHLDANTFYSGTLPQQVYGQTTNNFNHCDPSDHLAYLTPSPDSPENGAVYSPDPEPAPLIDWTSHETNNGGDRLRKPTPSQQSIFI